jgi:hypothetical protein
VYFSDHRCCLTDDPTELEQIIERLQYYIREESAEDVDAGKQVRYFNVAGISTDT